MPEQTKEDDYLKAFQPDKPHIELAINQNGKEFVFSFERDHLAYEEYLKELRKDEMMANKNLLYRTAVWPKMEVLKKLFDVDLTLAQLLINGYGQGIGVDRDIFVKK